MINANRKVRRVIAVVGPTGSGKTSLGIRLAKKFDGIIISADSRQVYRGLDIGTNKEGEPGEWLGFRSRIVEGVHQLMIDVAEPEQRFTLTDWLEETRHILEHIWEEGKLPIIVGGTGLYVTALLEGYEPGEGRHSRKKRRVDFKSLLLMIDKEREVLYAKSDARFAKIFDDLVKEVRRLAKSGVSSSWLESLGLDYKFATWFISRRMNREIAISQFQQSSRHYIRRQMTWWRHHGPLVSVKNYDEAEAAVQDFLKE